ncbi:MAG: hypothetical protein KBG09_00160 [Syntrophobacterales bacterium]|jgi:hypothetical protein|nr:hypothetical protein [Syntrophobacterales bacterium]
MAKDYLPRLMALVLSCALVWTACPAPVGGEVKGKGKNQRLPAAASSATPVNIKEISLKIELEKEILQIFLDRFYIPEFSRLEGSNPRIILDLRPVKSITQEQQSRVIVNGKHIKQMRSYHDRKKRNLRIVLDMDPALNYLVKPSFLKSQNLFLLEIREAGSK